MAGPKSFGWGSRISILPPDTPIIGSPFVKPLFVSDNEAEKMARVTSLSRESAGPPEGVVAAAFMYSRGRDINNSNWLLYSDGDDHDAVVPVDAGNLQANSRLYLFNGEEWDRQQSASADNLAALSGAGVSLVAAPGKWSQFHGPAPAAQATLTRAAGGVGVRHVADSITAVFNIRNATNQPYLQVLLRDGASGVGTILWGASLGIGGVATGDTTQIVQISGLGIVGSDNTAMTLEFGGAPVATNAQSVSLTGYSAS